MGTTKRVVKKASGSVKKKTVARKPVAKKQAAKKAVAKKVAKKAIKKATKKRTSKKTTKSPKKQGATNKLLKPKQKDTLFKAPKQKESYKWPKSVALSVLVMPKLPVDIDTLAIGMARYGGIGIVVLGAILTYFHAAALDMVPGNQFATAISSTNQQAPEGPPPPGTAGSIDPTMPPDDSSSDQAEPDVDFSFDQNGQFSEIVEIKVIVPDVDRVDIVAFRPDTGKHFDLGTADRISNTKFVFPWDTRQYPNASYKIKAVVIRGDNSYYRKSSSQEVFNAQNVPVDEIEEEITEETGQEEGSDETGEDANTVSEDEDVAISDDADVSDLLDEELVTLPILSIATLDNDSVSLDIETTEPASRAVFKFSNDTGDISTIGVGNRVAPLKYTKRFKVSDLDPGQYYFFADVTANGLVSQSETVAFIVESETTDPSQDAESAEETLSDNVATTDLSEEVAETEETEETIETQVIDPLTVTVLTPAGTLLSNVADLRIDANKTLQKIELYARKVGNLDATYLGNPTRIKPLLWGYRTDTRNLPNGEYMLFTRTWYEQESYFGEETKVVIRNKLVTGEDTVEEVQRTENSELPVSEASRPVISENDQKILDQIDAVELGDVETKVDLEKPGNLAVVPKQLTFFERAVKESIVLTDNEVPEISNAAPEDLETVDAEIVELFDTYDAQLDDAFRGLSVALRGQDKTAIQEAKRSIKLLEEDIIASTVSADDSNELVSLTENRLRRQLAETTLRTEQTEKIVRERVGAEALRDSDNDGITDFDERNIFFTDPESADSDNDGFIDGIEILNGFDPTNSEPEVTVKYESPKVAGVTREDVFEVTAITPIVPERDNPQVQTETPPAAVISGKGLPNSFVTLFVYSNPVVVTVKTDANGNWSYTFDKEIEDGEHEVYVGVTDNAGRVVAKSEPVRFVKTAQAFTPVDASEEEMVFVGQTDQDSMMTTNLILLVGSLSVVSIGVILILLGLHLRTREEHLVAEDFTPQLTT